MADESGITSSDEVTLDSTSVVKTPRRRALWGVLAAVAVAAGALAVTAGDDDTSLPILPVALGASDRDSAAGSMAPEAADMKMMAWVTYVAGDGLPTLGGEGPVYQLGGVVDEARVRALADAIGVAGDPVHEDGYWHLQNDDAVLEVYEGGGGSWWYSIQQYEILPADGGGSAGCEPGPAVDCGVTEPGVAPDAPVAADGPATTIVERKATASASCTSYEAEDGTTVEECVGTDEPCPPDADCPMPLPTPIEPQPPADLPSEAEARDIALDLLRATGMDVDDATVSVDGPYDAWYVMVEPKLSGVPVSGWAASVGVGSKGAITSASGTLASPELLGDYPLIDTRAAIDRLNEQQQSYGYGYDDVAPLGAPGTASSRPAEAIAEEPAVDGGAPTTVVECATQPDGSESCAGAGGDPGCFAYAPEQSDLADAPVECGFVDCLGVAEAESGSSGATTGGDTGAADCGPDICYETPSTPPPVGDDVATTVVEPCGPYPEPEPIEIVLDDAERVLVLLSSFDGSGDSYLLPGYRFSGDDGAIVEIAAVADESLAPTPTVPETTVPATDTPIPPPPPAIALEPGQTPEIGVGYYVDVDVVCSWISVEVADRWWWAELSDEELAGWSTPTEGGTFTLLDADHAEFVGDAERTKVAQLVQYEDGSEPPLCG